MKEQYHGKPNSDPPNPALKLWSHYFGEESGILCIARREGETFTHTYFPYPDDEVKAAIFAAEKSEAGHDVYFCANLLTKKRRVKKNAATVHTLWADLDGAPIPNHHFPPSVVVESSPGHFHCGWRLTSGVQPEHAERINKRLTYAIGADKSGWDLGQLLRVPGTANHKYDEKPLVRLVGIEEENICNASWIVENLPPEPEGSSPGDRPGEAWGEPPVKLGQAALRVWRGEDPKTTETGEIDRSGSLLKIGRVLFDAGATRAAIVPALAERDETLGWRKYTGRRNADEQYHKIMDVLEREGRNTWAGDGERKARFTDSSDRFSQENISIPPFPTDALPKSCARYVKETAASLRGAPELVGVPVLAALSGAMGYTAVLRIKAG
jgi:hypothetical protein